MSLNPPYVCGTRGWLPPRHPASFPSTFKNLSLNLRLGVGLGVIAWGLAGLYLSDRAEEKFGLTPSDQDKEQLRKWTPRVVAVDRPDAK